MTGLLDPSSIEYCPLCHICPQPLGVCCFVWAAGILLLLILLVALTGGRRRCPICGCRVRKRTRLCPDCGYNFVTGEPPAYARHVLNDQASAPARTSAAYAAAAPAAAARRPAAAARPVAAAPAAPAGKAAAATKTCIFCGQTLPANAVFCSSCGRRQ